MARRKGAGRESVTVLEQMGEWVSSDNPVTPDAREKLSTHLLDSVGAWIAGCATEEGAMLNRFTGNGPVDQVVIGSGAVKLTEIDDFHMSSCTAPGAIVI